MSRSSTERVQGTAVAALAPLWQALSSVSDFFGVKSLSQGKPVEIQKIELENQHLQNELRRLKKLLQQEMQLSRQVAKQPAQMTAKQLEKHQQQLASTLHQQLLMLPAQVIFRSAPSWGSSLWLNVGKMSNKEQEIVAKNSPVVIGRSIVGVVDYVSDHQCRVKLITDSGLSPSVRAVRGDIQQALILEELDSLIDRLRMMNYKQGIEEVKRLKQALDTEKNKGSWWLAKGELNGTSQPIWRSNGQLLKGIGFNYDFADEEGPARDLRTGISEGNQAEVMPILQQNDLLVTTGMDGVFPAGLHVGIVSKIQLLREGDYYYELEAIPTAGNINEIDTVFVLPPVGYDASNQPSIGNYP